MKIIKLLFGIILFALAACEPYVEEDITIGPLPEPPAFSFQFVEGDSNRIVAYNESEGFFDHFWSFPGGQPDRSELDVDTVFFPRAGEYTITLYASKVGGGGTSSASKKVVIEADAEVACTGQLELLAGGCTEADGKCWAFSHESGAVTVGPTPGSGEWFTSQADGLQAEQYDDSFCFYFKDSRFLYENNGQTIDPWNGYAPVPYDPPKDHTWAILPGAGENGEDRIVLSEGSFMGVWDASNIYDIVLLSEDELIVRTPFLAGGGWFELYFVAN